MVNTSFVLRYDILRMLLRLSLDCGPRKAFCDIGSCLWRLSTEEMVSIHCFKTWAHSQTEHATLRPHWDVNALTLGHKLPHVAVLDVYMCSIRYTVTMFLITLISIQCFIPILSSRFVLQCILRLIPTIIFFLLFFVLVLFICFLFIIIIVVIISLVYRCIDLLLGLIASCSCGHALLLRRTRLFVPGGAVCCRCWC